MTPGVPGTYGAQESGRELKGGAECEEYWGNSLAALQAQQVIWELH